MTKRHAFTLIEVMVAVMIVSVVIAALLQMRGNTSNQFMQIKKMAHTNQYNSFLLSLDGKYGFEKSNIDMKRLVEDFDLESDLRRKLSAMKVSLDYETLSVIDTNEFTNQDNSESQEDENSSGNSGIIFEIGKTVLKSKDFTTQLLRIKLQ